MVTATPQAGKVNPEAKQSQVGAGAAATSQAVGATSAAPPAAKPERVVETVKMTDGRSVEFVGKRKLIKTSTIDAATGSVTVKMDFRNGETRSFTLPKDLMLKFAAHGAEQKLGDETAGTEKVDDMVLEVSDLMSRLSKGEWGTVREPGGFAGASIVIRAIMEAKGLVGAEGKAKVQAFLDGKIEAAKAAGQTLSRKSLYDAFRNPASPTGKIIARIEAEDKAGKPAVDTAALLEDLT